MDGSFYKPSAETVFASDGFNLVNGAWGTIAWRLDIEDVINKRRNAIYKQHEPISSIEGLRLRQAALDEFEKAVNEFRDLKTMRNALKSRIYDSWTGEKDETGRWTKNSMRFRDSASL